MLTLLNESVGLLLSADVFIILIITVILIYCHFHYCTHTVAVGTTATVLLHYYYYCHCCYSNTTTTSLQASVLSIIWIMNQVEHVQPNSDCILKYLPNMYS